MTTLSQATVGGKLRVRALKGAEVLCHRLREMGFCESAEVLKLTDKGNMICSVCGTRVALSRELASHILVSPEVRPR